MVRPGFLREENSELRNESTSDMLAWSRNISSYRAQKRAKLTTIVGLEREIRGIINTLVGY